MRIERWFHSRVSAKWPLTEHFSGWYQLRKVHVQFHNHQFLQSPIQQVLKDVLSVEKRWHFQCCTATLLRPGPQQSIEDLKSAGVYVISSYIVVVSLTNEVQVHYLSLSNKNDDKICSTSQYSPIAGITDGRFSTIDVDTGSVFLLAKKILNGRIVVLQSSFESSKCQFSELISFKTFPPTADLQAMAFVDKAVHFFRRTLSGFFASEKQESNSHVYLNDVSKRLLMIIPKNKPFDATPSIYPLDLSDKTFTIIANWEPIIGKISPIGVPADSLLTTWIRLNGQHVSLNAQSTITLVDPGIKLSVTANLVDCSTVGLEGDACFKPSFNWPTGRGSVEFTEIFVSSVPDSTPVPPVLLIFWMVLTVFYCWTQWETRARSMWNWIQ